MPKPGMHNAWTYQQDETLLCLDTNLTTTLSCWFIIAAKVEQMLACSVSW